MSHNGIKNMLKMNSTVSLPLPNAETSLAWLEPGIAAQLEASRYLYCCVLGVRMHF